MRAPGSSVGENENAMALTAAEGAGPDRRFWCFMGRGEAAQRAYANFGLAPAPAIAASERTLYAHCSSCMEAIEREALSEEAIVAASMCAEPMRTAA